MHPTEENAKRSISGRVRAELLYRLELPSENIVEVIITVYGTEIFRVSEILSMYVSVSVSACIAKKGGE